MGLTATITESERLSAVAPPLFYYSLPEAVEAGFISPYVIYNLPVKFNKSEKVKYNLFTKKFTSSQYKLRKYADKVGRGNAFDIAAKAKGNKLHPMYNEAKEFWMGMSMRRRVVQNASAKIDTTVELVETFHNRKWILFSGSIKGADELNKRLNEKNIKSVAYHSKLSKAARKLSLEEITKDDCIAICGVSGIDAGLDVPTLNSTVIGSNDSVQLKAIQRVGRTVRLQEGKRALCVNLYVDGTQDEKWVKAKLKGLESTWIDRITDIKI